MSVFQSEDRLRLKRLRSEKAIQLAMQNRWEEAAEMNRQMLELFPNDVDTFNRLGKSLLELGRYQDSLEAYNQANRLDPTSTIAQKNIQRLAKLVEEHAPALPSAPLDPRLFIEESGRTMVTTLIELGSPEILAKLTSGDQLQLEVVGNQVRVLDLAGEMVGQLEPKLGQRVIRLIGMGNRYSAAVTSADDRSLRVILREAHRDPAMGNRPSFPTLAADAGRAYTRDILRYDLEDDDDESGDDVEVEELRPDAEGALDDPLPDDVDITDDN